MVPYLAQRTVTVSVPAVVLRSAARGRARGSCYEKETVLREENGHGDENYQNEQQN